MKRTEGGILWKAEEKGFQRHSRTEISSRNLLLKNGAMNANSVSCLLLSTLPLRQRMPVQVHWKASAHVEPCREVRAKTNDKLARCASQPRQTRKSLCALHGTRQNTPRYKTLPGSALKHPIHQQLEIFVRRNSKFGSRFPPQKLRSEWGMFIGQGSSKQVKFTVTKVAAQTGGHHS